MAVADQAPQLPGVLHRSRAADVLVAAEDDQRRKIVLHDLVGVGEAELERVLGGEERHHAVARHVGAEVVDQVAQVVLLLRADGAVGDHDPHALAYQTADGVVGVDPGVDAGGRFEFGAGRTQLDGDDRKVGLQGRKHGIGLAAGALTGAPGGQV